MPISLAPNDSTYEPVLSKARTASVLGVPSALNGIDLFAIGRHCRLQAFVVVVGFVAEDNPRGVVTLRTADCHIRRFWIPTIPPVVRSSNNFGIEGYTGDGSSFSSFPRINAKEESSTLKVVRFVEATIAEFFNELLWTFCSPVVSSAETKFCRGRFLRFLL